MKVSHFAVALGMFAVAAPASAEPDYATAIKADYAKDLGALADWFHRNPELSFKEFNTAARMAKELRATGATVTEKVGGNGVVAVIRNGDGPTVLVRADMDGLPVKEASGLPNMSVARQVGIDGVESPVMHACGHDTHITGLIAFARRMAAMKDRWKGTLVMIAQPAEERSGGAKAMIADGLYTRFPKPDYALGYHVFATLPTGKIAASEGIAYSSVDSVDITLRGIGTHGAVPDAGKDPIYMGAQLVQALQGLISRERAPLSPGVITVGAFNAGSKHNVISDEAKLQLTVRANDEKTRKQLLDGIKRVAEGVARLNGLPEDKMPIVKFSDPTPTTVNDGPLSRRLNAAVATAMGADVLAPFQQLGMGGEDFSYFVQPEHGIPGYFFAVGGTPQAALDAAANGGPPVAPHHSALFKVDAQAAIITGATAMTAAALDLMKPGAK